MTHSEQHIYSADSPDGVEVSCGFFAEEETLPWFSICTSNHAFEH